MWKQLIRSLGLLTLLGTTSANAALVFFADLQPIEEIITAPATSGTPVGPGGVLKPFTVGPGDATPRPVSFGTAIFVLNDTQTALSLEARIFNIDVTGTQTPGTHDNLTMAHIHSGVVTGGPDARGVVARAVTWGFFGMPDNDTNPNDLVVTPFATGVGGIITSKWDLPEGHQGTNLAAQLPAIFAGNAYLNFHTVQFGGGEIRGTLQAPEPGSLALFGLALLAVYLVQRRRKLV